MAEEVQNGGRQTFRLLLGGFGGLLLLLAFTGANTLSVLSRIQTRDETIRLDYVHRDRLLEDLRSDLYLSGTYVRDLILEPDPTRADIHRSELTQARKRVDWAIAAYQKIEREEEKAPFERFKREVNMYFDSLQPALQWNAEQRRRLGYLFMRNSLLPRRTIIVRLADQIGHLNQDQMNSGSSRLRALFTTFRRDLILLSLATLVGGLLLAVGSVYRILRLEHLSALRFEEVLKTRKALSDLSARLVEVQETERRALSRELHDEVGQALSALLLALGNAAAMISPDEHQEVRSQLLDTRGLAERTVAVVRDMCLFLRPSMLDDLGLLPALEWQARELGRTSQLRVTVQANASLEEFSDDQKTCVYRVVQEALRNVVRHGRANSAQIHLEADDESLRLTIHDDGQGFDTDRQKGLGLLGMYERVKHLNGTFQIKSAAGEGTTIYVGLPKHV